MTTLCLLALAKIALALPCSLVGATLGALLCLLGASVRREGRVIEIALPDHAVFALLRRVTPFSAITFGHVVLGISHDALVGLRSHELVHVRQYERLGVLFLLAYPASSILAWFRGECPYLGNRYEIEAYAQDSTSNNAA